MSESGQFQEYERRTKLADIDFGEHCVVIADASLPSYLLSELPDPILVTAGESLKTLASVEHLAEMVLQRRSTRPLVLVGVGGGSVGDAVGFLAAVLWRGVELWHVPTTLVAMVDSAHGGKTAVNLGSAKNQLGVFYPASRVFLIDQCLADLPVMLRKEGMVEVLKALWLGDAEAVRTLSPTQIERCVFAPHHDALPLLGQLIERAIRVKLDIVREDPKEERGIRTVLNLGHTVAHALELSIGMHHGFAVAWGLAASLHLSEDMGMNESVRNLLWSQLLPLLQPLPDDLSDEALLAAMTRDKKRRDRTLRSIVLQDIGRPLLVTSISANEWLRALRVVHREFVTTAVRVSVPDARAVDIALEASKSELNRALIIAAQRMGRTTIHGTSRADDVRYMVRALRQLSYPVEETQTGFVVDNMTRRMDSTSYEHERVVYVGEGGTTFRFLVALCCTSLRRSKIIASPALLKRPHEALFRALRSGGATIESFDDGTGQGVVVRGWEHMPGTLSVEAYASSQFASALALLAVGAERPFTLRLLSWPSSASYFLMTLEMLKFAGVDVLSHGDLFAMNQTERLNDALTLEAEEDASSRAVWSVAHALGHPVRLRRSTSVSLQPDTAVESLLQRLTRVSDVNAEIVIDLADTPDLLPVLAVAAVGLKRRVVFNALNTLRFKESNRLDDFASSLATEGVNVTVREDQMIVDARAERQAQTGRFSTLGDHRLAMAAALIAWIDGEVIIDDAWCVRKSYPTFWDDARRAGWSIEAHASGGVVPG